MAEENVETKSVGPSSPRSPQANNSTTGGKATASSSSSPHSPAPRQPTARRVKLTEQQLENLTKDELAAKWREQDLYVECLEAQTAAQEGDLASLRESEDKYRQQYVEASHREKILVRRLASKEQELQEYINQIAEMKAAHAPSAAALRSALLDPAVNILIQKLRQELVTTKAKLEDTQNELSAWKFTPDSNTGKRLMAKCRLLYQENEELGRMIASGRIAKLEGELALQKSFSEEVKKSQSELDEFLQDLDEDVEGMQSTIYFLQQELRKARESVTLLQQENAALKSTSSSGSGETTNNLTNGLSPHTPPIKKEDSEENINANVLDSKANLSMKTVAENSAMSNNNNSSSECKGARTPPLPPEESPPPRNERESVEKMEPRTTATSSSSSSSSTTTTVTPPTPTPVTTTTTTTSSSSSSTSIVTGTITSVASINQISSTNQADNIDESSSDSAALIIKVETEDLSDRDENDDDDDEDENEDDDDENGRDSKQQQQQQQLQQQHKEKRRNLKRTLRTTKSNHRNSSSSSGGGKTNGEDVISRTTRGRERTKRDKSAAGSDEERTTSRKKKRRESILSIDYNEADDDALVLTNGETLQSDPE